MPVERTERDGVRILALRRPPVNAIELGLLRDAEAAVREARSDASCRALVLTGAPGIFSAGLDTRVVPAYAPSERQALVRALNQLVLDLYGMPKPTVAAISGHALAGGLVLALLCDLRLAARGDFRLGLPEIDAGILFPAGPLAVVKAELPAPAARYLGLAGGGVGPESPQLGGAIDRVVEPERLLDDAVAWARSRADAAVYARIKQQLRGETLATLRRIVEEDADPVLEGWF